MLAERFEIEERIARDPWVTDYRAVDQESETQVVLRIVEPALLEGADGAALATKLGGAVGIGGRYVPGLLAVDWDDGRLFVVEPMPTGVALSEVLHARAARGGGLTPTELLPVAAQLVAALEAIPPPWSHGDVRIERIWLDPDRLQLTLPFVTTVLPRGALSTAIGDDPRLATIVAPEAVRGMTGETADRYGVACVTLEALTGEVPSLQKVRASADPVAKVAARYLDPDPKKRPSTLRPILEVLAEAAGLTVPVLDAAPFRRPRRPTIKRPLLTPSPSVVDTMPEEEPSDLTESTSPLAALSDEDAARALAVPDGPPEPWVDALPTVRTASPVDAAEPAAPRPESDRPRGVETVVLAESGEEDELSGEDTKPRPESARSESVETAVVSGSDDELSGEDTKPRSPSERPPGPRVKRREVEGAAREGTMEISMDEAEVVEDEVLEGEVLEREAIRVRAIPGAATGGTMEIDATELLDEPEARTEVRTDAEARTEVRTDSDKKTEVRVDSDAKTELRVDSDAKTELRVDSDAKTELPPMKRRKRRHDSSDAIDPRLLRAALGVELEGEVEPESGSTTEAPKRRDITEEIGADELAAMEDAVLSGPNKRSKRRLGISELVPRVEIERPAAGAAGSAAKAPAAAARTPGARTSAPPARASKPPRQVSNAPAAAASSPAPVPVPAPMPMPMPTARVPNPPLRRDPTPMFTPTGDYQDGGPSDLGAQSYHTPGLVTSIGSPKRAMGKWILLAAVLLGAIIILGGVLIASKRRSDIEREQRLQQRWIELQQQQQESE